MSIRMNSWILKSFHLWWITETSMFLPVGQVTAVTSIGENIVPIICAPVYSFVYKSTVDFFPGAYFLLTAAITFPTIFIYWWVRTLLLSVIPWRLLSSLLRGNTSHFSVRHCLCDNYHRRTKSNVWVFYVGTAHGVFVFFFRIYMFKNQSWKS